MGRRRLKPEYDAEKIQQELEDIVVNMFCPQDGKGLLLREISRELSISVSKVIKVLITAGVYSTDISVIVGNKHAEGKTVAEIQKELGVSRSTVQSYLPYQKGVYNAKEISLNAERIRRYRERQRKQKSINLSINLSKNI